MLGQKLGHLVKSQENLVYTLVFYIRKINKKKHPHSINLIQMTITCTCYVKFFYVSSCKKGGLRYMRM